jgi:deferrochelatase/peroxidase EfeB
MAQIDPGNVQGLIFRSYNYPLTRHFFFTFGNQPGARRFLQQWVPRVTRAAANAGAQPDVLMNLAFTWPGLGKAGLPVTTEATSAEFSGDFRDPPNAKAMRDSGDSAPAHWWNGRFRSEDVDVVLLLYCRSDAALATESETIRQSATQCGLTELLPTLDEEEALTGRTPAGGILHFGYRDGISKPDINWNDDPDRPDLIDFRHFLLGYDPESPSSDLVRDGCYLVLRWIYQDVARFNKFLRVKSHDLWPHMPPADAQELLAAKMMGRWRNGTPLILSPDKPETEEAKISRNDFGYATDPDGVRCPFSAHIRIVNRRDDQLNDRNASMFPPGTPRITRRGSTYGPPLEGEVDDGKDRGLIGMFLCANIESQFFVLMRWINETNFHAKVENRHGQDPLFGNRNTDQSSGTFELEANGQKLVLTGLQDFIRTKGTLILFVPSMKLLRDLATA